MNLILMSYPRAGSHFLKYLIESNLNTKVHKKYITGQDIEDFPIIGLVRNPIDSITSFLALLSKRDGYQNETTIRIRLKNQKEVYASTIDFISKRSNLIIDYGQLENTKEVINKVKNVFGLSPISSKISQEDFYKDVPYWKKESSKTSDQYNLIKSIVEEDGLIKYNNMYLNLIRRKGA